MKTSFARIITKFLDICFSVIRHFYYTRIYLSWVDFGRGVKILGRIECRGVSGQIFIGDRVLLGSDISISVSMGAQISIGNDSSLNRGSVLSALVNVNIGDRVRIGEYCSVRDNDHRMIGRDPIHCSGFVTSAVIIEDDVWIGRGSVIMKGVRIGCGAVIGANSVVTKDVPDYAVAIGAPARVVRLRS